MLDQVIAAAIVADVVKLREQVFLLITDVHKRTSECGPQARIADVSQYVSCSCVLYYFSIILSVGGQSGAEARMGYAPTTEKHNKQQQ